MQAYRCEGKLLAGVKGWGAQRACGGCACRGVAAQAQALNWEGSAEMCIMSTDAVSQPVSEVLLHETLSQACTSRAAPPLRLPLQAVHQRLVSHAALLVPDMPRIDSGGTARLLFGLAAKRLLHAGPSWQVRAPSHPSPPPMCPPPCSPFCVFVPSDCGPCLERRACIAPLA